jgi:nucleotide-binding universal stress UspA family protein
MEVTGNNGARTIVVGVDASPESDQAVAWARRLAGPSDHIVLMHAWQLPIITGYDMVVSVDPTEVERYATQGLAKQVEQLADERLVPVIHQGHPGRSLVAEADERQATMIVVGHRGNSRVAMMLGSTANYVLHHTTRPVVVVRGSRGDVDGMAPAVRRVVVGVDAGEAHENPSVRALQWAYGLPGVEQVHAVHAWFLPALAIGMFADVSADVDAMDAAAQAVVDQVLADAGTPPSGIAVTGEPVRGTPGFALIEASRDADLVVVGSRGRGGFAGLVLGSTNTEITAHSHCPVAVLR